jgi:hypothetical protein
MLPKPPGKIVARIAKHGLSDTNKMPESHIASHFPAYLWCGSLLLDHINNHAGAAPAQIGMKTGRRKIARFLVKSA